MTRGGLIILLLLVCSIDISFYQLLLFDYNPFRFLPYTLLLDIIVFIGLLAIAEHNTNFDKWMSKEL